MSRSLTSDERLYRAARERAERMFGKGTLPMLGTTLEFLRDLSDES